MHCRARGLGPAIDSIFDATLARLNFVIKTEHDIDYRYTVINGDPLMSFPRYVLVVFPLWIWLALWIGNGARARWVLAASAALLAGFTAQFATWRFVA